MKQQCIIEIGSGEVVYCLLDALVVAASFDRVNVKFVLSANDDQHFPVVTGVLAALRRRLQALEGGRNRSSGALD